MAQHQQIQSLSDELESQQVRNKQLEDEVFGKSEELEEEILEVENKLELRDKAVMEREEQIHELLMK